MAPSYCQGSLCGTVNYRPYVGDKIRWRYGTEPWQEISGADDYTTETVQNTSLNTSYELVYRRPVISNNALQYWDSTEFKTGIGTFNSISSWRMRYVHAGNVIYENPYSTYLYGAPPNNQRQMSASIEITSQGTTTTKLITNQTTGFWGLRVQPINASLQTTNCIFKVFKKGVIVHQETRSLCPEVQKIPCSLATDTKSLKIQKAADLERIEVNNTGIPSECLNIYTIHTTGNTSEGVTSEFLAQICSAPGCPPPQYEVVCCATCESCPAGTCAIECGNQICCYGADGVSVQSINLANYCRS